MLLDYFGLWYRHYMAGSAGSKGRVGVVVIEVDGKEYRVPIDDITAFLASIKEEVKERPIRVRRKKGRKTLKPIPPKVIVKSVPAEYRPIVMKEREKFKIDISHVITIKFRQYLAELDEEEALILLLA